MTFAPAPIAASRTPAVRVDDSDALALLYHEHAATLLRTVTALLGDRAAAEDVIHDLFVGLPEALAHYQERGSLRPWLGRIAVRMALTRLRSERRRREDPIELAGAIGSRGPAEQLPDRLLVHQALAQLTEPLRTVIVLRDLEGWSYRDIAELLGEREGTVMTRRSRAMQRLREIIGGGR